MMIVIMIGFKVETDSRFVQALNFVSSFIYPLLPCNQTTNTSDINSSHFEKKLVQTTNMLGQKMDFSYITLFYYNDGTVEKNNYKIIYH